MVITRDMGSSPITTANTRVCNSSGRALSLKQVHGISTIPAPTNMKIISGAQTGADQAGLDVAHFLCMPTGGYITKGGRTSNGPLSKDYIAKMSLVELSSASYQVRTWKNVEESDGTIRLAINFNSLGEKCTMNAIRNFHKPHLDVDLLDPLDIRVVRAWLMHLNIQVLNVAGNTQWTGKMDIYKLAYQYLLDVFNS